MVRVGEIDRKPYLRDAGEGKKGERGLFDGGVDFGGENESGGDGWGVPQGVS